MTLTLYSSSVINCLSRYINATDIFKIAILNKEAKVILRKSLARLDGILNFKVLKYYTGLRVIDRLIVYYDVSQEIPYRFVFDLKDHLSSCFFDKDYHRTFSSSLKNLTFLKLEIVAKSRDENDGAKRLDFNQGIYHRGRSNKKSPIYDPNEIADIPENIERRHTSEDIRQGIVPTTSQSLFRYNTLIPNRRGYSKRERDLNEEFLRISDEDVNNIDLFILNFIMDLHSTIHCLLVKVCLYVSTDRSLYKRGFLDVSSIIDYHSLNKTEALERIISITNKLISAANIKKIKIPRVGLDMFEQVSSLSIVF